jgi:alpha-galactosidase
MNQPARITAPFSHSNLTAHDLDHAEWSRAEPIEITRKWSGEDAAASRHAEAKILWTKDSLLVRFDCHQEEPLNVNTAPQLDSKRLRLWDRDVCEIFVAPESDVPNRYFEFEAAPTGEWIDLAINFRAGERETDFEFQSGMTTTSRLTADKLIVVICIPWSDRIPKPKATDVWRVNLFRCVGEGDERYMAWQPTFTDVPNFHVPKSFGELVFL